jgi:hypothetical protein
MKLCQVFEKCYGLILVTPRINEKTISYYIELKRKLLMCGKHVKATPHMKPLYHIKKQHY